MASFIFVRNLTRTIQDPPRIQLCDSFLCRLRGLMFRSAIGRDEGLLLGVARDSRLDSSIHMFFVPFDLAIFWINSDMQVVDRLIARRWHPAYLPAQAARYTLEVHPERFEDFHIGDKVEFKNV
jgi:uncharacterized membrane protein (UPF0127 family)